MPPAEGPASAPQKPNVLALIALIMAVVGFIFACIPGALIVGWVLLPIAFVLSIVSLFLKGSRKWMGVVGLVLSIIGTIVGFVVFFAVIANAAEEAFGDEFGNERPQSRSLRMRRLTLPPRRKRQLRRSKHSPITS